MHPHFRFKYIAKTRILTKVHAFTNSNSDVASDNAFIARQLSNMKGCRLVTTS